MSDSNIQLARPFCFMVQFWGRRYREYFVDLCLPSLLAPRNLPLLNVEEGHRFLMATTQEDWEAIAELPIMDRLRRYAKPVLVEIQDPRIHEAEDGDAHAGYQKVLDHQNGCLRSLVETAYQQRPYGCMFQPDVIVSDGMMSSVLRYAKTGSHLVLCPALRQTEESVITDLGHLGLLPKNSRLSETGQPLVVPPRVAARLAVRHLHPEMAIYEEADRRSPPLAPFRYWRITGGRGILLHTYYGCPMLMDYSVVDESHTACMDHVPFENTYIKSNFARCGGIRIIQDSDEFSILSLTPETVNWSPAQDEHPNRSGWRRELDRLCDIRAAVRFYAPTDDDVVRRELFRVPVRWHLDDLDDVWNEDERAIEKVMTRVVGYDFSSKLWQLTCDFILFIQVIVGLISSLSAKRGEVGQRLFRCLRGDAQSWRWMVWRVRVLIAQLRGNTTHPPMPD